MSLSPALARYDHVLLDLDGCLWVGDHALEGAPEAATLQLYDRWRYRWRARRTVRLDGHGGAAFRVPRGARTYARVVLRRAGGPGLVTSRVIRTSDGRTAADPDTLTPPGGGGGRHGGH